MIWEEDTDIKWKINKSEINDIYKYILPFWRKLKFNFGAASVHFAASSMKPENYFFFF